MKTLSDLWIMKNKIQENLKINNQQKQTQKNLIEIIYKDRKGGIGFGLDLTCA